MSGPGPYSRHAFTETIEQADGTRTLSRRKPYRYQGGRADDRVHTVQSGDTLTSLAGLYFRGLPRASGFWWVIADYQPAPITDPTLALVPGSTLVIPSPGTLTGVILADRRRREF